MSPIKIRKKGKNREEEAGVADQRVITARDKERNGAGGCHLECNKVENT